MSLLMLFKPTITVTEPEPEPEPTIDQGPSRYATSRTRRAFFGLTSRSS